MTARHTESLLKQGHYEHLEDALFLLNEEISELRRWHQDNDCDKAFDQAVKLYAYQVQQKKTRSATS